VQRHLGVTVDQGVVHLDEHGETDVIEPFDAVHLVLGLSARRNTR
jgi:hypothetical protein